MNRIPVPGISRDDRISDTGLQRLEKLLEQGRAPGPVVRKQWVTRYGEQARQLLQKYGYQIGDTD